MKTLFNIILIIIIILFLTSCTRQQQEEQKPSSDPATCGNQNGNQGCHEEQKPSSDTTAKTILPAVQDTIKSSANKYMTSSRSRKLRTAAADTLVGEIYVAGNEPFTRLMLSLGPSKSINLEADTTVLKKLWRMQGERIKIVGTIKKGLMGKAIVIKKYRVVK